MSEEIAKAGLGQGQSEAKLTPGAGSTLQAGLSPQFLDNTAHDGQAQSVAANPNLVKPLKRLKETGLLIRGKPPAFILDPEVDKFFGLSGFPAIAAIPARLPGAELCPFFKSDLTQIKKPCRNSAGQTL